MNPFEAEKEELALIYDKDFYIKGKDTVQVDITLGLKHASITFTVPDDYPNSVPKINAELGGISGTQLETQLTKAANTMIGLTMIAYLIGEATDYLNGISDKDEIIQQENIKATPFSREAFLLWLDKFKKEMAQKEAAIPKRMTGRQFFESQPKHTE
ncbi:RWD domain-containing protein 1 [Tritrichomonas musculus]|uniref:RWD domain-containing protein 1 n=1 Tax=Tritrichomonas musculus TaxID=1915356 RepID=A0ABR2KNX2_9EUKA